MEIVVQVVIFILGLVLLWAAQGLARIMLARSRARGQARAQARHHFVNGAQILARSRSARSTSQGRSLAREASFEADKAISLDPADAACHVLKALALEQQGNLAGALESMNIALAPSAAKTLSQSEKADAFMKRAGLLIATSKGTRGLESAVEDLQKSLDFNPDNSKVHCMLGLCYEKKGLHAEAENSYERALHLDTSSEEAKSGLARLRP